MQGQWKNKIKIDIIAGIDLLFKKNQTNIPNLAKQLFIIKTLWLG